MPWRLRLPWGVISIPRGYSLTPFKWNSSFLPSSLPSSLPLSFLSFIKVIEELSMNPFYKGDSER